MKSFKLLAKTDLQTVMLYCTCKRTVRNYAALPGKCDVFYAHSLYVYKRDSNNIVVYVYTCSVRVHVHFVTVVRKYGNRILYLGTFVLSYVVEYGSTKVLSYFQK